MVQHALIQGSLKCWLIRTRAHALLASLEKYARLMWTSAHRALAKMAVPAHRAKMYILAHVLLDTSTNLLGLASLNWMSVHRTHASTQVLASIM